MLHAATVMEPRIRTNVACSERQSDITESFSLNLLRGQELMQRLQLFREREGHMRLLLMLLISQAIYYTANLAEDSQRRTNLDAEKVVAQENEAKGHGHRKD